MFTPSNFVPIKERPHDDKEEETSSKVLGISYLVIISDVTTTNANNTTSTDGVTTGNER